MFGLGINRLGTSTSRLEGAISGLFKNGEAGVWYDPSDVEASLTWRRNLHEYSESFSLWTKTNIVITEDVIAGPYENTLVDKFVANSGAGTAWILQDQPIVRGQTYTQTIFAKAGEVSWLQIAPSTAFNTGHQNYNLATGELGTNTSGIGNVASIENIGNGWYRCSLSTTAIATTSAGRFAIGWIGGDDGRLDSDATVTPDGVKGVYIWGAQIEQSSTATEYQPIHTTFDNAFKQAFPKHTLYQDSNGKTAVTGLGQAVGLMLDKSEGVALGNELVTNGDFSNGTTGWASASSGVGNVVNGQLVITSNNPADDAYAMSQSFTVVQGESYKVSASLISTTGSSLQCRAGSTNTSASYGTLDSNNSLGNVSMIVVPTTNTMWITLYGFGAGDSATFDNISVVKIQGSHATQSDSTKRPVFARHPERGRVNLFKYTEEFDNGAWTKSGTSTITVNAATAPNGTQTADRINNFDDVSGDRVYQTINITNSTLTGSVWVKGEGSNIGKNVTVQAKRVGGTFVGTAVTHTLTDSWVRIDATFTQLSDNTGATLVLLSPASNSAESLLVWGAQLEKANEATGYQKVVDDYDITESGYKSVYYLQFDGVNDGMQINNLTSSSTPITALFGYSKQNMGTTYSYLLDIESGRNIIGTGNQANQLQIYDTTNSWQGYTTTGETQVATFELDTNDASIRKNGIEEFTTSSYVISPIGGRVGLFAQFNTGGTYSQGNLYQCVLRAATSTDKEIDQAEEFVAIKTGLKSEVVGLATLDLNFGANTYTARNSNGSVL